MTKQWLTRRIHSDTQSDTALSIFTVKFKKCVLYKFIVALGADNARTLDNTNNYE